MELPRMRAKLSFCETPTYSISKQIVEALYGMRKRFATPYIIFYPIAAIDGLPFPVNTFVRDIQGHRFQDKLAWRGDLVVVKYKDPGFSQMHNISMADFPIIKNYLSTHCPFSISPKP